ncbi:tetratricopeptide repeat protein [Breznakiellaceae bacterium SP9]
MNKTIIAYGLCAVLFSIASLAGLLSCVSSALSAEEYYSLGMAYFELATVEKDAAKRSEKYAEAQKWFNQARSIDKTQAASEYNLGRIAYETGRYEAASEHFETILAADPQNIMALKAAAYCKLKLTKYEEALNLYERIITLVPNDVDDGFNYALVLYTMEQYEQARTVLAAFDLTLVENSDALLLYARTLAKQDNDTALDYYAQIIAGGNTKPRYEYAQLLEKKELYAKAIEQYRLLLDEAASQQPSKALVSFTLARLLLTADPDNKEGVTLFEAAIEQGFDDSDAIDELLADKRVLEAQKSALRAARIKSAE